MSERDVPADDSALRCLTTDPTQKDPHKVFSSFGYQLINQRRLEHLATLGLPVRDASVLEVGAGIGDLTAFFINRGCRVSAIEPRAKMAEIIAARLPSTQVATLDIESAAADTLPVHDIVFAYGLLYHLKDPEMALRRMAQAAGRLLLLETQVSPLGDDRILSFREDETGPAAGVRGFGCNPTRLWIHDRLKLAFRHVYLPTTQPNHPEFPTDWANASQEIGACRAVFVAARSRLDNPLLQETIPMTQARAP